MRPIRAKHTPDSPTVGIVNANIGDMPHKVSIGNDTAIPKASNKDQKDMGYINTTESKHHTFIKACKNDA